jgi:hypothetical protein
MARRFVCSVIIFAAFAAGCSKSDGSSASPSGSSAPAPGAAAPGESAKAASLKDMEARLVKAGWEIGTSDDPGHDWPSRYIKMEKGKDDDYRSATVWIDALGEPLEGKPKPHVEMGKGALIRFGWDPTDAKKPAPDVAGFAKDIVAVAAPEKATDDLFNNQKYDEAVKKWGMTGASNSPGGRLSPADVVFNHRSPGTDGGTLRIEIVHYVEPLQKGDVRLFGTTLVGVQADDEATKKAIFDALGG